MSTSPYTLLIVDDVATDRELYRRALRSSNSNYHLLIAESVAAALELCRSHQIDAVLLDYLLPDGNGLDFLERLAVQTSGSNPPVVMISGQGNERIAVRAIKMGAADYLVKSDLTAELLLATLRSAIENNRLQRQLRQCEQRFGTAIENMLDCFGICSAIRDRAGQIVDFRFDYLNMTAMQSNRMTEADRGKTLCEVFPALRETGLFAEYCQVVETGIPLVKEDLVYTDVFGGERLTNAYNVQIAKLDDGFTASWRDITAQKQVELSLTAANQQITTIWESMTDAYVTLDRDWQVVYTNSAATEVYRQTTGLLPAEYLGRSHWEVFPATVGTIVEREYHRAVTDRVAVHFELFYELTETWFEVHAYPSDVGLGIYFRNIDDLKRIELARIAAEQERDRFFDLRIDLLVVANLEGYFVRVNPVCEEMLGFTSAEMMAQPFLSLVHPDDLAATMAVVESLSAGNTLVNFENRYRCQDGSYRWLLWSAIPDLDRQLIYANGRDITARKRDEELLRQSEELTRRILESNRDCIKVVDLAGRLIYMNDYGQSLMEIDDFSTVARSQWCEFWQDSDRAAAQTAFSIALAGGVKRFDGYCATSKGTPKWWEVIVTPILGADGQVSQILSVSRDITERQQAAALLQAQQATIQQQLGEIEAIYLSAPIGLSYISNELKFVRVNERLAQINGLPIAAHIGLTIRDVLPEMADAIEALYRQVIESGEPIFDLELSGSTPSQPGVERHWLAAYYPQTDLSGRVVGVNATVQEITDRKRLEAARVAAEQERDRFFNLSIDLLAIGNFDGYFTRLNPAWEQVLGYTTAELMAQSFVELIHPEDVAITAAAMRQGQNAGVQSKDFENRYRCKDGSYRWLSWSTMPYPDRNLMYGIARDITARKQTQAALEDRNRELDSFVYVVSHDLKAPLRAVANLSRWIEDDLAGQLTAATRTQMNLLRSRVDRMAGTIDGLLDYARVGRSEDAIEPVAVARLLADVIDTLAPPPTFAIALPAELPILITKRLPLFQVFVNLIGNGIKHHHSEAGTIGIAIAQRGDWYEFAVSDDGSGIAPEHQERMFKIFQAVNPQNRSDSTGIGLAIVKKIVEAEGGTIWLESELGKGTTFYFTWPKG
ncbi:PAS domain-containing protein [Chamaesiphon sp. OTE_20_metabat_361]|uniref:PAS domain-containing protein n=1 Tax=Chamaesiphon sp. OTE_20_metabat_361 TaxID=2964689 RepID=UPI00286B9031|nr:PAS domain-containing protein [Chamaesiphon sp. OTE_20_metabat_361]